MEMTALISKLQTAITKENDAILTEAKLEAEEIVEQLYAHLFEKKHDSKNWTWFRGKTFKKDYCKRYANILLAALSGMGYDVTIKTERIDWDTAQPEYDYIHFDLKNIAKCINEFVENNQIIQ